MKKYLSYGGGVNSVAMLLLLLDEGWEFESSRARREKTCSCGL